MSENFCLLLTSCDKGTSQTEARGAFLPHHPLLPLPRPTCRVPDSAASWPHPHRCAMGTGGAAGMGALLFCLLGPRLGFSVRERCQRVSTGLTLGRGRPGPALLGAGTLVGSFGLWARQPFLRLMPLRLAPQGLLDLTLPPSRQLRGSHY